MYFNHMKYTITENVFHFNLRDQEKDNLLAKFSENSKIINIKKESLDIGKVLNLNTCNFF